jgi:hypothetical protein
MTPSRLALFVCAALLAGSIGCSKSDKGSSSAQPI